MVPRCTYLTVLKQHVKVSLALSAYMHASGSAAFEVKMVQSTSKGVGVTLIIICIFSAVSQAEYVAII